MLANSWLFLTQDARGRVLVFGALISLAAFLTLRDFYAYQFGFFPDAVEYTLLAHTLLNGPAFGLPHLPQGIEPTHYPFGYPLVLTPFVLIAPQEYTLPQWLSFAALLASGSILFWGWRTFVPTHGNGWRYAVTAMFLLTPTAIVHARTVLSEMPFTLFVLLTLFFGARLLKHPQRRLLWLAFAVASFFMVEIRSVGWVILGGVFLYLVIALREKIWRGILVWSAAFIFGLTMVLVFTPVTLGNLLPLQYAKWFVTFGPINPNFTPRPSIPNPTPNSTNAPTPAVSSPNPNAQSALVIDTRFVQEHVRDDLRRFLMLNGGGSLDSTLAQQFNAPWLLMLPGSIALGLLLLGNFVWARRVQRVSFSLFQFATFGYLLIVFLWRGGGERLFYPVAPQVYFALLLAVAALLQIGARGVARVTRAFDHARAIQVAHALLGVFVLLWLMLAVTRVFQLQTSYELWGDLKKRTDGVAAATPREAILLSDWPALDYIHTARRAVSFPPDIATRDQLQNALREHAVDYIVISDTPDFTENGIAPYRLRATNARRALQSMLARGELERVYVNDFPLQVLRLVR